MAVQTLIQFTPPLLQLSVRGFHRLVLVLGLVGGQLLVAGPVHSPETFSEDWVRVVEGRVEPVGVHRGQVLDLQLEQRRAELHAVSELNGERIYENMLASR